MSTSLDRRSGLRWIVVSAVVAGSAAFAGCGNNFYAYNAPAAVVIADFTGSGHPGVAVAQAQINQLNTNESPGYVAVALQNPNSPGTFGGSAHYGTQGNPSAMAVGALTPGTLDIAVANVNDSSVSVLLQTAPKAATFKPAFNVSIAPAGTTETYSPEDLTICDVNGDGAQDLVVGYVLEEYQQGLLSSVGGGINVMLGNPSSPGQFLGPTTVGSAPTGTGAQFPNSVYGIACGNLSGNATAPPDLVMASYFYYDQSGDYGTLSILFHDPSNPGGFLPRVDIPLPGFLHRVVIADVNGDGLPDIIVADEQQDSTGQGNIGMEVLLQNTPAGSPVPTFAAPVLYQMGSATPMAMAVGDVNGDGLPDIVAASSGPYGTGSIIVLYNDPSSPGTFPPPATLSPACSAGVDYQIPYCTFLGLGSPTAVALGQLGNNSLLDIAVADGGGAAVLFNQAATPGVFLPEQIVGG